MVALLSPVTKSKSYEPLAPTWREADDEPAIAMSHDTGQWYTNAAFDAWLGEDKYFTIWVSRADKEVLITRADERAATRVWEGMYSGPSHFVNYGLTNLIQSGRGWDPGTTIEFYQDGDQLVATLV